MPSHTVVGFFENVDTAETARAQLIKEGTPASAIETHHHIDASSESEGSDYIDGSAVGSAIGTGIELGALAAIPIVGPWLASGPLQKSAQQTDQDLEHAFEDFGRKPSTQPCLRVTTANPDQIRDRLRALGATLEDD